MSLRQRPESFRIDYTSPLARGLVFAGLGQSPGSVRYKDSSSRRNDGTLTGMSPSTDWCWVPELKRWGTRVGLTRSIIAPSSVNGQYPITLSAWTRYLTESPEDNAAHASALRLHDTSSTSKYYSIGAADFNNPGVFRCALAGRNTTYDACLGTVNYAFGTLLHITGVFASATQRLLYVNGVLNNSDTSSVTELLTANRITVGNTTTNDVLVTDPLVYSRALTSAEIAILANPSDPMLGGLVQAPKRKYYVVRSTAYSRHYFLLQSNLGKSLLRLTS